MHRKVDQELATGNELSLNLLPTLHQNFVTRGQPPQVAWPTLGNDIPIQVIIGVGQGCLTPPQWITPGCTGDISQYLQAFAQGVAKCRFHRIGAVDTKPNIPEGQTPDNTLTTVKDYVGVGVGIELWKKCPAAFIWTSSIYILCTSMVPFVLTSSMLLIICALQWYMHHLSW